MSERLETMIEKAVNWAQEQLGSTVYKFRCLAFVEDAYETGNQIEIFGGSTAKESADEYGAEKNTGAPPRGTFAFYDCFGTLHDTHKNWGHVGLSLGDDKVIHAWGEVRIDDYLEVENLAGADGWTQPRYIGWASVERILRGHRKKQDYTRQR